MKSEIAYSLSIVEAPPPPLRRAKSQITILNNQKRQPMIPKQNPAKMLQSHLKVRADHPV